MSRFFKSLEIQLINCEFSLDLKWSKNCVLTSQVTRDADDDAAAVPAIKNPTNAEFSISYCKLYAPVVTLSTKYENKLYQKLKEGFSVDVYRAKITSQLTNQRSRLTNYLIDPAFNNASKLYVLAYENEEDRSSFSKYYTPTVEIKDYIDQQPFFELPVRNKKETC